MNAPAIAVSEPEFVAWVRHGVDDSTFASEFPSVDFDQVSDLFDTDIGRQAMWELFPRKRTDPGGLAAAVTNMDRVAFPASPHRGQGELWAEMLLLAGAAARWVLSTRTIPPNKVKALEDAIRLVNRTRSTRNVSAWWASHGKHVRLLASALNWPARVEARTGGRGGTFRVEPFLVHDTLNLNRTAREEIATHLEEAVKAIRSKGVPYSKVLYGEVHVVGQLLRANTAAWYSPKYDSLNVRPALRTDHDVVQTICHELGHRFWEKDLSDEHKRAWAKRFAELTRKGRSETPAVGGVLVSGEDSFKITKFANASRMLQPRFDSLTRYVEVEVTSPAGVRLGVLPAAKVKEFWKSRPFPTPYAATDVGELFAESFGNYMVGELTGAHLDTFLRLTSAG
jgi:hypothetical protein